MSEQIPNRIEAFADLSRFVYLRQCDGELQRTDRYNNGPVVIAEEICGETGRVVRSFFVMLKPNNDGFGLSAACPPCRIVSRDLRPDGLTPDYEPNAEATIVQQIPEDEMRNLQPRTYIDALQRAADSEATTKRLQEQFNAQALVHSAELKQRDDEIWDLKNLAEANHQHIANLQASYLALSNRLSLKERAKVWCRSKLKGCGLILQRWKSLFVRNSRI
jgi:hypothetical protein